MSKLRYMLLACAAVVGTAAAPSSSPPVQKPLEEIAVPTARFQAKAIPFELFRSTRIFFDGEINGRATPMMLDSGAGMTVVDLKYAKQIGLTASHSIKVHDASGGGLPGQVVRGVDLKAGGLELKGADVLLLDMSGVERAIGRPVPVVLGHDAFAAGVVQVDFPGRRLSFVERSTYRPLPGSTRIPMKTNARIPSVELSINGLPPIHADFDLGNGGSVLVSKDYWQSQPDLSKAPFAHSETGGVSGVKAARLVTAKTVTFAGEQFDNVPLTLNDAEDMLPAKGANIGLEMVKPFVIALDLQGGTLDLKRTDPQKTIARDRSGARVEFAGDRLRVRYVSPEGPAAAAGLRAGDELLAINGVKVGPEFYRSAAAEWNRAPAGTAVVVTRADGSTVRFNLRDYF